VAPEIVGPVTRETAAGREVERATLRFGIDTSVRAALSQAEAPAAVEDAGPARGTDPLEARPGAPPEFDDDVELLDEEMEP
jgi:hypothetical protein